MCAFARRLLVLSWLLVAAQTRAQAPQADSQYQALVTAAIAEYDREHWAEARALFQQVHELQPSARSWRTLGMTSFELRDYVTAQRELRAALQDERRPLDERLREEVEALLDRTRAFVGRFRVQIEPPSAILSIDQSAPVPEPDGTLVLGIGQHSLRASAPGYAPAERALRVNGREDARIAIALEPIQLTPIVQPPTVAISPAADGGRRIWTWVAGGSAVALGAAAIGFGVASNAEYSDLLRSCHSMPGGACPSGKADTGALTRLEVLSSAGAIAAGAAAVTAVVLYFIEGSNSETREHGSQPALRLRF